MDNTKSELNEEQALELESNASSSQTKEDELEAQLAYENLKRRREEKKRKRTIIIVVVALVAVIAGVVAMVNLSNSASEKEGSKLVVSMAYKGEFSTTVTANGATEPVSSTLVTPEVEGIIENLQVAEGSVVNEGDVLFTLKNESLDKAVREANVAVESAERAVNSANAAVDEAYAAYNNAAREYNASEGGSFDESSLRAGIRAAEDSYATAVSSLEDARTKLEEARANANKRTVTAPVSGTIVNMTAKNGAGYGSVAGSTNNGSASNSSGALMQISDLSQMKVTVQVNEVDISSIAVGQRATATFSALPNVQLDAEVLHIASVSTGAAGESTGGGVVNYAVDLLIPQPDPNLKPGMTASVTIITQSVPDTIVVPSSAVQDGPEGKYVNVVTDEEKQETKEVAVEVLAQNSSEAAVKGEINDGDMVAIGGADDGADYLSGEVTV